MKSHCKQTKKPNFFDVKKLHVFPFFFPLPQGKALGFSRESLHNALNSQSGEEEEIT